MNATDPFDLERFVTAQASTFDSALREIRAGRKRSHWMWFVFPQMRGLGSSSMARAYGIGSLEEARAYLAHPILGPRLFEITEALNAIDGSSLQAIFRSPDDIKLRSSATLFAAASTDPENAFRRALEKWCDGERCARTMALSGPRD